MTTLNEIKARITAPQRAILNAVWEYHIERDDRWAWMPTATLYRNFADLTASRKIRQEICFGNSSFS